VLNHPLHPSFFVRKLWGYFIPVPPDAATSAALEQLYRSTGWQVRPVLEAILCCPQFYEGPRMVKPPIVLMAGLMRATGRGIENNEWWNKSDRAGQRLFYPPDVSGWNDQRWLDTNTTVGRWEAAGVALLAPDECGSTLDRVLESAPAHVVIAKIDWDVYVRGADGVPPLLRELTSKAPAASERQALTPEAVLAWPAAERAGRLTEAFAGFVASALQLTTVRPDVPLSELGVDSLMAIEIRNRIQRATAVTLPVVAFLSGATTAALAADVSRQLDASAVAPAALTAEAAGALLGQVGDLSDTEVEALLNALQSQR
jgi:hypothetical protein